MDKRAYSVKELSQVLGIGKDRAYALVRRPDFPAIKLGTKYIIPAASLDRWLEAGGKERAEY